MRSKRFEYFHKDIKQLKKDIAFRVTFSVLFFGVIAWQLITTLLLHFSKTLTQTKLIISAIVLISALVLFSVTLAYAIKDCRIVKVIKENGRCVSSVSILFSTDKTSFLKFYQGLMTILTVAITLLFIACVTYSILEISFYTKISFYMPLLLMICLAGYNSIYHVKDEILTQNNVQEQRPV